MTTRCFVVFFVVTSQICFYSCQTASKITAVHPGSQRFPTKSHKAVTVLKRISVDADTLKTLLIVPNQDSWIELGKKINYFKEVMTIAELQRDIIAKGLTYKIPAISDRIGLYNACKNYKPFVMLSFLTRDLGTEGVRTRLSIYDPIRSDVTFQNEVRLNLMWEGYSDQKVLYPLLNSFVDYLNEQKQVKN